MKTKQIDFNDETGEVYRELEYTHNRNKILVHPRQRFVKMYPGKYAKYDCVAYERHFMLLIGYLEQNTNRLVHRKKVREEIVHKPLGKKEITSLLGVSRQTCWRFLDESQKRGYIVEASIRRVRPGFYINPIYANNGKGVSVELFLLFEHDKAFKKTLSQNDIDAVKEYLGITD